MAMTKIVMQAPVTKTNESCMGLSPFLAILILRMRTFVKNFMSFFLPYKVYKNQQYFFSMQLWTAKSLYGFKGVFFLQKV